MAQIRIDKYLADMGIGTRSEVKKILKSGQVTLNGEKIKKPEQKIKIGVVIGPEGGLEEKDVELLKQKGAKIVTLGNRILRTETVALNILSVITYELEQ